MLFSSVQKISRLDSQRKFQMFTLFTDRHIGEHGDSILSSTILRRTFRRISQVWDNAHTLKLGNSLLYLSSITSQFLDLIHCMVFDFIFYCVTMHTLYYMYSSSKGLLQGFTRRNIKVYIQYVLNMVSFWGQIILGHAIGLL